MDESNTEEARWRLSRYAPPDLQNPSREEIYDEMTAHIKGDKPASGEWTEGDVLGYTPLEIAIRHNVALADAQEKLKLWEEGEMPMINEVQRLREQLAAEREKVQTLTDALKDIQRGLENPIWTPARIADAALAKVK